jgi:hypothetical protein
MGENSNHPTRGLRLPLVGYLVGFERRHGEVGAKDRRERNQRNTMGLVMTAWHSFVVMLVKFKKGI